MKHSQFHLTGTALALALCTLPTHAVRLNDIEVGSYLNEPLKARIQLTQANAQDLESLVPSLASARAFQAAGIERTDTLASLTFTLDPQDRYLYIQSQDPIKEPFLLFLMRADWDGGSSTREYALLLDLPGTGTAQRFDMPVQMQADAVRPFIANPEILGAQLPQLAQPTPAPTSPQTELGEVIVKSGDSLSRIARQYFDPTLAPSLAQFTQALFELNPKAFIRGDINLIRAGASLQIPQPQQTQPEQQIAQSSPPPQVQEIAVIEAPSTQLNLVSDNGIVEDSEAQFLRQRIQELELQLAQMQAENASREAIGELIASETGGALAPLAPVTSTQAPQAQPAVAAKTGPVVSAEIAPAPVVAAVPPATPAPELATSTAPRYLDYWQPALAGLATLLLGMLGWVRLRARRSKVTSAALEPQWDEPDLDEAAPAAAPQIVKAPPRLATQERCEHALLLCAYGQSAQAITLLSDAIEQGQDDDEYRLVQTLARITQAFDPDGFQVLMDDQLTQYPERLTLHDYLRDLAGQSAPEKPPAPAPAQADYSDNIVLGGDSSLDTIEFTLELDEGKN